MAPQTNAPGSLRSRGRKAFCSGQEPATDTATAAVKQAVAYLHLHRDGRDYYSVTFDGEQIVERSHVPELDAARALYAKGIVGKFTMLDGKTGEPRTVITNIEKAAKLTVKEGPLRFTPKERRPTRSWAAETPSSIGMYRADAFVAVRATHRRAA